MVRVIWVAVVLVGCIVGELDPVGERRSPVKRRSQRTVGQGIVPHERPELWPFRVSSARVVVHYQSADERAMAEQVLDHVEHAWQVQIDAGGALPPLDDRGAAGPDGRFDVYVWRGSDEPYVYSVAPEDSTWYDDWSTAMVVDPWGKYGGAALEATIFHELRHATQASDDWWEHPQVFEADATLWEVAHYGMKAAPLAWRDYQAHPEWSLFRDDGYRTWYMYGAALFLLYLRDHAFGGKLAFSNEMWRRSRNAPGADEHPALNEPDFVDALQLLLAAKGRDLLDEIIGFARARWYTGARANGSLPGGADVPEVAHRVHARKPGAKQTRVSVSPQLLGTSYVVVERAPTDPAELWVSLSSACKATRFVVQSVGGAAGDAVLDLDAGPARVSFGAGQRTTLVITALPANGVIDPDEAGSASIGAVLTLSTAR